MRRTKSDKLHPASQVIAAALSQYTDPEEDVIRYNPGDPDESLWYNLPIFPIIGINCVVVKNNFHNDADIGLDSWIQYKDEFGATVPIIVDEHGGGIQFGTSPIPPVTFNHIQSQNRIFQFKPFRETWMEVYVHSTDEDGEVIFGLTDQYHIDTGTSYADPVNGVTFHFHMRGGHPTAHIAVYDEVAGDTYAYIPIYPMEPFDSSIPHRYGVHITTNEAAPWKYDIRLFLDGDPMLTYKKIDLPKTLLGTSVGAAGSLGTTITVKEIIVFQEYE